MKSLAFKLIVVFLVFSITLNAQKVMTPKQIFFRLIEPVVNDKDGIDFILNTATFVEKRHDEHTYYEWDEISTGLRLSATFEHFENLFIYGEGVYRWSKQENKYLTTSKITTEESFDLEFGGGMKFPVPIGKTGLIFEGEVTTTFDFFNPILAAQLKWENKAKNVSLALRNSIVARDASIWNPGLSFEYRILPRNHAQK